MSLLDCPQMQVIMPGGSLRRESISLIGYWHNEVLAGLNVQTGFFGARGITVEVGLTDVNLNEVTMKRELIKQCRQVVGVIDSRKWGKIAAATFAPLDQVDCIISNTGAPEDLVAQVRQVGVEVILV
jgi:DeoR/GlpR family transcriptional regulator of sugar metabolism